jgi:hypothetical protein
MSQSARRQRFEALWWLVLSATFGSTGSVQAGLALQYGAEWTRALAFGLVLVAFGCASAAGKKWIAHSSTCCRATNSGRQAAAKATRWTRPRPGSSAASAPPGGTDPTRDCPTGCRSPDGGLQQPSQELRQVTRDIERVRISNHREPLVAGT